MDIDEVVASLESEISRKGSPSTWHVIHSFLTEHQDLEPQEQLSQLELVLLKERLVVSFSDPLRLLLRAPPPPKQVSSERISAFKELARRLYLLSKQHSEPKKT